MKKLLKSTGIWEGKNEKNRDEMGKMKVSVRPPSRSLRRPVDYDEQPPPTTCSASLIRTQAARSKVGYNNNIKIIDRSDNNLDV